MLTNQYPFLSWSCRAANSTASTDHGQREIVTSGSTIANCYLNRTHHGRDIWCVEFLTRPFVAGHTLILYQWSSTNVSCSENLSVSSPALESATQTAKSSSFTRRSHPMATVSGSHRVYAFWNRQRRAYVMYIIYLSLSIHAISTLWVDAGPRARLLYALG